MREFKVDRTWLKASNDLIIKQEEFLDGDKKLVSLIANILIN